MEKLKQKLAEYGPMAKNASMILALVSTVSLGTWAIAEERIGTIVDKKFSSEVIVIQNEVDALKKAITDNHIAVTKFRGEQINNQKSIQRELDKLDSNINDRLNNISNLLLLMNSRAGITNNSGVRAQ